MCSSDLPPTAWESIAVTGKARAAIRRATKKAVQDQYSGLGTTILVRAFERAGKTFSEDMLKSGLARLARKTVGDVLSDVGRGDLISANVVKAVFPDYQDERITQIPKSNSGEGWFGLKDAAGIIFKMPGRGKSRKKSRQKLNDTAIPIRGYSKDQSVRFAPDGGAVPGDRIVGIMTPGEGITIYPIQSPALK